MMSFYSLFSGYSYLRVTSHWFQLDSALCYLGFRSGRSMRCARRWRSPSWAIPARWSWHWSRAHQFWGGSRATLGELFAWSANRPPSKPCRATQLCVCVFTEELWTPSSSSTSSASAASTSCSSPPTSSRYSTSITNNLILQHISGECGIEVQINKSKIMAKSIGDNYGW